MESMAVAFPVKPGKAQEWRDRGREFRGARRNEYLAFRRRWGLTVNRLYFQLPTHAAGGSGGLLPGGA